MNVSEEEWERALLAGQRSEKVRALTPGQKKSAERDAQRQPSGRDLRRWARSQERLGRKQQKWITASEARRRRGAAPSARELFPVLQAKRLAARPVVGYTAEKEPVFGVSTFRNVIDENGKHI